MGAKALTKRDVLLIWAYQEGELTERELAAGLGCDSGTGWNDAYPVIDEAMRQRRAAVAEAQRTATVRHR